MFPLIRSFIGIISLEAPQFHSEQCRLPSSVFHSQTIIVITCISISYRFIQYMDVYYIMILYTEYKNICCICNTIQDLGTKKTSPTSLWGLSHRQAIAGARSSSSLHHVDRCTLRIPRQSGLHSGPGPHLVVLKLHGIWVNYNELTTSSLEIIVSKGNHPQMAFIQVSELL